VLLLLLAACIYVYFIKRERNCASRLPHADAQKDNGRSLVGRSLPRRGEQSAFQRAEPIPGILNAEAANGARRLLIAAHDRPQKSFDVLARLLLCCCCCLAHSILIAACQYGENHATHAPAPPRR